MVQGELQRTCELLFRFGWNTTCYQIVNPGIKLWLDEEAVVGYVRTHRVRVVAGAPVCAEDALERVVQTWESDARHDGLCYFGAEARMRGYARTHHGYATVVVGAQPIWTPESLIAKFERDASLRAQRARARNKGLSVSEWPTARAERNQQLRRVLEEWLETRGLPPMHFLVEPETLDSLAGRRVFVAERDGEPVGFLVLSPIPARRGWLTEQFIRGRNAPNGTVESMMISAVEAIARDGDRLVTMGIVPLARLEGSNRENPVWLRLLMRWAKAHGRRFYNFEGLEWFKDKFHPDEWEPIYVISKESRFSLRSLYAVAVAFTGTSPVLAVAKGLAKAIRTEVRDLFNRTREPAGG